MQQLHHHLLHAVLVHGVEVVAALVGNGLHHRDGHGIGLFPGLGLGRDAQLGLAAAGIGGHSGVGGVF